MFLQGCRPHRPKLMQTAVGGVCSCRNAYRTGQRFGSIWHRPLRVCEIARNNVWVETKQKNRLLQPVFYYHFNINRKIMCNNNPAADKIKPALIRFSEYFLSKKTAVTIPIREDASGANTKATAIQTYFHAFSIGTAPQKPLCIKTIITGNITLIMP